MSSLVLLMGLAHEMERIIGSFYASLQDKTKIQTNQTISSECNQLSGARGFRPRALPMSKNL